MSSPIKREAVSFPSTDGKTQIHGYCWSPQDISNVRAVMLLAHGMEEHIERYDDFARFLADHGFMVFGHDHLGHGESVNDRSEWGCLPLNTGATVLVEDLHRLRSLAASRCNPKTPCFVFGHSMGSFVVRSYITRYGDGLAGAIICGTGFIPPATSRAGNVAAHLIAAVRGANFQSTLLDNMGVGAYNKSIQNPRTQVDWLSYDEENVDTYLADEKCGFMFSAGGYATVTALTGEVCSKQSAANIPKSLPLLYISGVDDPVGSMGKGVEASAALARDAGVKDVQVKLYEGMRHEILNEVNKQLVYEDVVSWLDKYCNK